MATNKEGPIIKRVRWLADSSGVAFLAFQNTEQFRFHQLFVADIGSGKIKAMTPDGQDVQDFDIQGSNYVYEVAAPELLHPGPPDDEFFSKSLVGMSLIDILFPAPSRVSPFGNAGLWAVIDGDRFQVKDRDTGSAVAETFALSISPDGKSVVAILKNDTPPENWKSYTLNDDQNMGQPLDGEAYYLIDVQTGRRQLLVNAPAGRNALHWDSWRFHTRWSQDSKSVLLSYTFLPFDAAIPAENVHRRSHPCTAVVRVASRSISCVLSAAESPTDRFAVNDLRFDDDRTVVLDFDRSEHLRDQPPSAVFRQGHEGSWQAIPGAKDSLRRPIKVDIREDINQPPIMVGENDSHISRVIWDPNSYLANVDVGRAEVERWKDASGFQWEAGLVMAPNMVPGRRYPLVIQTHGFDKNRFLSNGPYPTAFAARALASAGIIVLQMPANYATTAQTPREGLAQIAGFESAVKLLEDRGIVDPDRVGIIGFSRTVYHVLEALTKGKLRFAAASITQGVTESYYDYLLSAEVAPVVQDSDSIYGAAPFTKAGLKSWVENAPGFNMEKVRTPLLLLQNGQSAVWEDWEPYAALRSLKKPVDLIMLPSGNHVMTNPRQRLASETTNVDWFRFWLKDEEDDDPTKANQYIRWRELRKLEDSGQTQLR